ncbi:hypothetical protein CHS0354_015706 [Potamilus streckersoni]|uniref:Uncharacterized protein n=1 Tax=Potamilus streckersoni TaxID=2493646 RepID=A0AAE0WDH0_9BIVA|nr:hypothetical protein CHS0354_015706 [Potamilus streckersoni]
MNQCLARDEAFLTLYVPYDVDIGENKTLIDEEMGFTEPKLNRKCMTKSLKHFDNPSPNLPEIKAIVLTSNPTLLHKMY